MQQRANPPRPTRRSGTESADSAYNRGVSRTPLELMYPGIEFEPRTTTWLARLTRRQPECIHLTDTEWMATYAPDTVYLQGRARRIPRESGGTRPGISLCRECLLRILEQELAGYAGRVVAFEPDAEYWSQYFFVNEEDFAAAGMQPELGAAISARLEKPPGECSHDGCGRRARWLWLSRDVVGSLDDATAVLSAPGESLCARHGAARLCTCFSAIAAANLFYLNLPYGDAGAYVWI